MPIILPNQLDIGTAIKPIDIPARVASTLTMLSLNLVNTQVNTPTRLIAQIAPQDDASGEVLTEKKQVVVVADFSSDAKADQKLTDSVQVLLDYVVAVAISRGLFEKGTGIAPGLKQVV